MEDKKRILERFESKIFYSLDSCWYWVGTTSSHRYGKFSFHGKIWQAHRVSYALFKEQPGKLEVCHTCDNPLCVNPDHLFLGTHLENMNDMVRKGRSAKGYKIGAAKFTDEVVMEIRSLYGVMTKSQIARKYGASWHSISDIINRETWIHI